jgi:hypothetical protein
MRKIFFLSYLIITISVSAVRAQTPAADTQIPSPAQDKELKFNLSEDGKRYFKATFLNQTWIRYNGSNPGTLVFNQPADQTFDIGLRRTRFQLFGQITDYTFLYFQLGQNNFGFTSPKQVGFFIHDAVCEVLPFKNDHLKLGGGLTIASGLSRYTQPSVGTILTMDVPVFAQATTGQIDQFSRRLSVYARGQLGKLDYRFILSDPFRPDSVLRTDVSNYAYNGHHRQYQTYLFWQFLEKEANTTPYMTGTYLGKKKVFNLGGGLIYQKDAMWNKNAAGLINYQDLFLLAFDAYLDIPLSVEKQSALSAYAGLFFNDYGKNYVRYNGIMNPATSSVPGVNNVNGFGNRYPMFGTGTSLYTQVGYLLPQKLLGEGNGQLQPYATYTLNSFDALHDPGHIYNAGINYLLRGHKSKFSLDYQNRPVYGIKAGDTRPGVLTHRGQLVLQYQIYL